MLFATASLARRIEQAETSLVSDIWRAVARRIRDDSVFLQNIGGGAAVLAGPTSPISKVVGIGFEPIDEEHRRRGVQTTLLRERLADAAREGCDVAIVTTQPGSPSQENVQRQGFELLYARAILIKPV